MLIFCQDVDSTNGTFYNNRRLTPNKPRLLNHGDCIGLRHAAEIYLIQQNLRRENVKDVEDRETVESNNDFQIHNRILGEGGMAKAPTSRSDLTEDYVGSKPCLRRFCCM